MPITKDTRWAPWKTVVEWSMVLILPVVGFGGSQVLDLRDRQATTESNVSHIQADLDEHEIRDVRLEAILRRIEINLAGIPKNAPPIWFETYVRSLDTRLTKLEEGGQ